MSNPDENSANTKLLHDLIAGGDIDAFWRELRFRSNSAETFEELFRLSQIRRKSLVKGLRPDGFQPLRVAVIGGCSLYPLTDLIEHLLSISGIAPEIFAGEFDNYVTEILDQASPLYAFQPQAIVVIPSEKSCKHSLPATAQRSEFETQASRISSDLMQLCRTAHERSGAEILLCNFRLPPYFDPGPYRTRTLSSDWSFRRLVNLELGLAAPAFVHICDVEFLASRRGGLSASDERGWLESKQPCSPNLLVDLARETSHILQMVRSVPKKVLVLDLDNTLWGGVIGDHGMDGIEIGSTSPRGEAFRAFQEYILSLTERGILLAVCSKNHHENALEPFEKHPEMILRPQHFVSFVANWNPKPDNLRRIASELNLGLDSFVFVDDERVEIDMMQSFTPEVTTLWLGPDPADYVKRLKDARLFEPLGITDEDRSRTARYVQESKRKLEQSAFKDVDEYLASLNMTLSFSEFRPIDTPRLSQLINKSNQFNVTTRRRTESEVAKLISDESFVAFSARLTDRLGDYGLITIVICKLDPSTTAFEIDTWVMSCRVLSRQVEEEVMNEIARLATKYSCNEIKGVYIPTTKNQLVKNLYPRMGFQQVSETPTHSLYLREVTHYQPFETRITVLQRAYD